MLDRPWLRVVLGVLAAAALGALAARVALAVPGAGGAAGSGSATSASEGASGAARGEHGSSGTPGSGAAGADGSGGTDSADGSTGTESSGEQGSAVQVSSSGAAVVVHVVGAVRRPGVYTLREGQRVTDAVRQAGGATKDANPQGLNLAAPVRDGQQIVMPARQARQGTTSAGDAATPGGTDPATTGSAGASGASAPVAIDLNTASVEQLQTLDGVGPTTAQKIVKLREEQGGLRGVDDLDEVPGIGPKKLEAIRAQLDGGG